MAMIALSRPAKMKYWDDHGKKVIIETLTQFSHQLPQSPNIFIVHGQDLGLLHEVEKTVKNLGISPIILKDQPNLGRTILQKLDDYADVDYAIILLTPDDVGKSQSQPNFQGRARQNVIYELGYFSSKLGPKNLFILCKNNPKFEKPSDIDGLLYCEYDSQGTWKIKLKKELEARIRV
ncbi:MAG: hypothetical protein E4G98_06450 [Promethearchaeota archaeon]|nr:MAG: hypothetical protein E4G98_06450 [Candidatus Lokiarchaeota archaeon]